MKKLDRRQFIKTMMASGSALILPGLCGCIGKNRGKKILNFYNYSNYIHPKTIPGFEAEFKTRVNTDYYSKQEILFAKIKIGVTGYDIIIATDNIMRRFLKHNLLVKTQSDKIPNLNNLKPRFRHPPYDPDLTWSIPYLWGATVIAYNKKYVKDPQRSWSVLWDTKYQGKISMLDEKRDLIGATLIMLGYSGNDTDRQHVQQAKRKLLEQRPLLRKYTSDSYQDDLITNETWLCQAWSGDVIQAMRANKNLDFFIPEEGSFIWVDNCCIPKGAQHLQPAQEFMNYLLRPEVGYRNALHTGYPTPNEKAFELLRQRRPEIANDERIYPPEHVMKKLEFYKDLGDEEKYWNQVMEDVKLGKK